MDGVGNESSGVCLDEHQLEDIDLLVCHPCLIELLEVFCHVIDDLLHSYIYVVLDDPLVDVADYRLNNAELLEEFPPRIKDLLRKYVLFAIDPKVGETLLRRVKNLRQIAQRALLVEDLVGFAELLTVVARSARSFVYLAESLDLVEETLARALSIFTVEIVLLVWPLLQVVTHHDCVFKEQEIARPPILLDLGQWTGWRGAGSYWDQFGELEFVLVRTQPVLMSLTAVHEALLSTNK